MLLSPLSRFVVRLLLLLPDLSIPTAVCAINVCLTRSRKRGYLRTVLPVAAEAVTFMMPAAAAKADCADTATDLMSGCEELTKSKFVAGALSMKVL